MKFTHTVIPNPQTISYRMFGNAQEFAARIIEQKKLIVHVDFNTSKSLFISIQLGEDRFSINVATEGLKYHKERSYSFASGGYNESFYLKVLKHQQLQAVQQHVEVVIGKFMPMVAENIERLDVYYYATHALRELES
jgi:hypothetical protein